MKKTAVIIETKDGVIKEANYGMITCAAKDNNSELYAFIINEEVEPFKAHLKKHGIDKIVDISIPIDSDNHENQRSYEKSFNPILWSDALTQALTTYEISSLFALTTPIGKELLPRIAAQLEAPLVMDCLDVVKNSDNSCNDNNVCNSNNSSYLNSDFHLAKTSLYSGKTIATVKVTGDIRLFGIRPNAIEPSIKLSISKPKIENQDNQDQDQQGSFNIESSIIIEKFIAKNRYAQKSKIKLIESKKGDSSGNDLVAADVIISGGRAMKNSENFKILQDCADAIENLGVSSTAVGASRVAVDLGWVPYRMQVGQTGEKVNPKVYIACGVSGSIQHFAGMKMSKIIIAINENINAAIMSNCNYFVEADLFEIVPAITKELKR
ncbi:MAG: electron transfer flavoprotein subunit alpha/FixB family protein [Desulfamplus sp.]|nr:electron transfer flavoprotein subunit alpha/FixB family protein [Desulfamplus sp.]